MLEQALDELAAGVFRRFIRPGAGARQEHFALDVDEQRCGVDELAGDVDVRAFELVDIGQELGGDAGNRDVVDVDVLLADEVKEEVERSVIDEAHADRKRRLLGALVALFLLRGGFGGGLLVGVRLDGEDQRGRFRCGRRGVPSFLGIVRVGVLVRQCISTSFFAGLCRACPAGAVRAFAWLRAPAPWSAQRVRRRALSHPPKSLSPAPR